MFFESQDICLIPDWCINYRSYIGWFRWSYIGWFRRSYIICCRSWYNFRESFIYRG